MDGLIAELEGAWSLEAFEEVRALAESGNAQAQYYLGNVYETANGVVQNLADAVHWYLLAAEQGYAKAQARLGLIYFIEPPPAAGLSHDSRTEYVGGVRDGGADDRKTSDAIGSGSNAVRLSGTLGKSFPNGFGVGQNYVEAAKWNRRAADAGIAEAQTRFAHQLALGLGVACDPGRAMRYFHAAARQNDPAGQAGLGILIAGGYGGKPRYEAAVPWLQRAASAGNAAAQYWLGQAHLLEASGLGSPSSGLKLLRRAAEQGHTSAMYEFAMAVWRGDSGAVDLDLSETWLRRAASRGHDAAIRALGQLLLEREDDDGIDAANWLRQGAEKGDRRSAALLAELYLRGRGVPRDLVEASHWLGLAGTEARTEAYALLAAFHAKGSGAKDNYAVAVGWLGLAARRGSVAAQFNLGSLYGQGRGLAKNERKAAEWYRRAALAGNTQAAFYLGLLYAGDVECIQNYSEAARWFRRAMRGGHGPALCNFALLMIQGRGVGRDVSKALRLLENGANAGCVDAAELLVDLYGNGEFLAPLNNMIFKALNRAVTLGSVAAAKAIAEAGFPGYEWSENYPSLINSLKREAASGSAEHLRAMGRFIICRKNLPDAAEKAYPWFKRAAEEGDPEAQAWMGDCARLGLMGAVNLVAAEHWYRKAAGQGHVTSLVELCLQLESSGASGEQHDREQFGLWLAAASAGNVLAQRRVAECYLEGKGCVRYPAEAVRWLTSAARGNDREAQRLLSRCFRDGSGVRRDLAQSRFWSECAENRGN